MSQRLRVVALQPQLRQQQPMANMFDLRKLVEGLAGATDLVVLPEGWSGLGPGAWNDKESDQALKFLQNLARSSRIHVVGGTIVRNGRIVAPVIAPDGACLGEYAKCVLFGSEQDSFEAGNERGIFEINGWRVGILICADLWSPGHARALRAEVDLLCVPAKTAVPSDQHVGYARELWHCLALTRAMENGFAIVVSDWAAGRHSFKDVDVSVGSVHSAGTQFDRGVLYKRHRDRSSSPTASGPLEPTAMAPTSAQPALGTGTYFTAGASSVCDPGQRPDIERVQRFLSRGSSGQLAAVLERDALEAFRDYRRKVGLLEP